MPIPNEYVDVIKILATASREGRVKWRAAGYAISVSISGSDFRIWAGTDEETQRSFVSFGLQDPKGKLLDTWSVDRGDEDYDFMDELYGRARRQAHGVPELLASLTKAMNDMAVIGEVKGKKDDDAQY